MTKGLVESLYSLCDTCLRAPANRHANAPIGQEPLCDSCKLRWQAAGEIEMLRGYKEDIRRVVNRMEESLLQIIRGRNEFHGPSLDYMQGYRDGEEHQARIARKALGHNG